MNVHNLSLRYLSIFIVWALFVFSSAALGVTEQVRVNSSNDDAEERISDGDMYRDSTDLEFGYDDHQGGLQIVGMRFKSVDIPKGAIINSAYIEFETDERDSRTTTLVIVGEDGDSPKEFKNGKRNISKRTKTSASANWTPSAWNSTNELHRTPNISAIIQEIVDRTGWAANNHLVLIVEPGTGCTTITCQRTAESYDGESGSSPLLVVDYTVGASKLSVSTDNVIDEYDVSSYGGSSQDRTGTVEVRDAGLSLYLEGNRWQKIDLPYTVTTDTVIEFDFQSTEQGEIHGLGFDDNLTISQDKTFKVHGTQNWGNSDFATYSGNGITHFTIPVGKFYTGIFQYLFFVNDDDSNSTGNSLYSNIAVYEANFKGSMNVDNTFRVYISTDDSVQGTLIGSGDDWPTTVDIAANLTEGQDYYLHVYATDVGGVAGFLGDFELTGTSHTFSNGLTVLDTNTSDWSVSTTGWENYQPASGYGLNGVSPWGNRSGVNGTAEWIWSSDNENDNVNYFSAKIFVPTTCDVGTLNAVGIKIGSGSNSQINTTTEALVIHSAWLSAGSPASGLIGGGTYNVSASGSNTVDRIDFGGSSHDFSGTLTYPGVGAGVSGSDFLVHTSGTLSLPAGTYTIYVEADDGFSFIMDTLSGDAVSFNKFGSSTSGQSNELRFENPTANSNTGGSFTLTEDSVFDIASVFFERGGGDYLEISISNDIRSNAAPSGYEILKHGALGGKVKFGDCVDPSQIDHYQIIHDGNGLTCTAEEVIIKACTNTYDGTCTLSDEPVTLVVNTTGSDIATDTITFTGEGTANLAYTKSESTILSIVDASVIPTSPAVCFDGSTTSCNLFFADTGFRFFENVETNPIPTQVSAKPSSTLKIQAIKKDPIEGSCQAAFIDATAIEMAATCVDPIACAGSQVAINNLITTGNIKTLNKDSVLSYSSVNLDFSDDTVNSAEFILTYPDAGKIQLHARYNIPDENGDPSDNYMLGTSNQFVVRPFGFYINVADNPKAETAAGTKFIAAGKEFSTVLKAVQWEVDGDTDLSDNQVTKNFGNEQNKEIAEISPDMVLPNLDALPNAGVLGNLTNVTFDTFSAGSNAEQGIATNDDMTYSEVGIISFTANLSDNSYLGADDVVGSEPYVGRFIPDHFILDKIDGDLAAICENGSSLETMPFAYSGQMSTANPSTGGVIRYSFNPSFTITAKSVNGANTTLNYTGDFMKLISDNIIRKTIIDGANTFFAPIMDGEKDGSQGSRLTLTSDLKVVTTASLKNSEALGVVTYTYRNEDNFVYHHVLNAETEKFTADVNLPIVSVIDSDNVTAKDADDDFDNDGNPNNALDSVLTLEPTGVEIRFGRAQLENSYGPDTSDLPQTLSINYYTDNGYVLSDTDTCTTYTHDNITITDISLAPGTTDVIEIVSGKFFDEIPKGETRNIILTAPTTGPSDVNTGQVGVIYTINDWLKYDWDYDDEGVDGLYNDNPRAVATFGIYRGNDRIIYQREISR